jgi:hypothetical protein
LACAGIGLAAAIPPGYGALLIRIALRRRRNEAIGARASTGSERGGFHLETTLRRASVPAGKLIGPTPSG